MVEKNICINNFVSCFFIFMNEIFFKNITEGVYHLLKYIILFNPYIIATHVAYF